MGRGMYERHNERMTTNLGTYPTKVLLSVRGGQRGSMPGLPNQLPIRRQSRAPYNTTYDFLISSPLLYIFIHFFLLVKT